MPNCNFASNDLIHRLLKKWGYIEILVNGKVCTNELQDSFVAIHEVQNLIYSFGYIPVIFCGKFQMDFVCDFQQVVFFQSFPLLLLFFCSCNNVFNFSPVVLFAFILDQFPCFFFFINCKSPGVLFFHVSASCDSASDGFTFP